MTDEERLEYFHNLERRLEILPTGSRVIHKGATISIDVTKNTIHTVQPEQKKKYRPWLWSGKLKPNEVNGLISVNLPLDKSSTLLPLVQGHIKKVMANKSYQRSTAGKHKAAHQENAVCVHQLHSRLCVRGV